MSSSIVKEPCCPPASVRPPASSLAKQPQCLYLDMGTTERLVSTPKNKEMHGRELPMLFTKKAALSSYSYGTWVEFRIRICNLEAFFRFLLQRFGREATR